MTEGGVGWAMTGSGPPGTLYARMEHFHLTLKRPC